MTVQGETGETGATGARGPAGARGTTGATGAQARQGLPPGQWRLVATVFVSMLLLAVAGVVYTTKAVESEGKKLCGIFTLLDDSYRKTPPPPAGVRFAALIHQVVRDLGCPKEAP